jgi:hypothetical protein
MPKIRYSAAIIFSIAISLYGFSQVVMSGNTTMSGKSVMTGGNIATGSWSDGPRRATLSIGLKGKDEIGKDRFLTGGAAVLIRDSANRIFIATALHVFDNPTEHWAPESLQVRGWRDEQKVVTKISEKRLSFERTASFSSLHLRSLI